MCFKVWLLRSVNVSFIDGDEDNEKSYLPGSCTVILRKPGVPCVCYGCNIHSQRRCGGVAVTVVDDFSEIDSSIPMGEVTLLGEQAINFVRTRKDVGDQLNLSRIERQKEYSDELAEAFRAKQSTEFILSTYEEVALYLVSDCSVNTISGMLNRYEGYEIKEIVTPEGENVLGEEYYEFYVDEEKLDELVIRLFYAPK